MDDIDETQPPDHSRPSPFWDAVEDIKLSEAKKFGLTIFPYFYDVARARRLKMDYVYLGLRN
jgi:hypothetical protein